jgi:hypothetical protein
MLEIKAINKMNSDFISILYLMIWFAVIKAINIVHLTDLKEFSTIRSLICQ